MNTQFSWGNLICHEHRVWGVWGVLRVTAGRRGISELQSCVVAAEQVLYPTEHLCQAGSSCREHMRSMVPHIFNFIPTT